MKRLLLILPLFSLISCQQSKTEGEHTSPPEYQSPYTNSQFAAYWDQGEAELNSYTLEQSRYGANRTGEAVLIFVTEDFLKSKQVKADHPEAADDDAAHILKLNFTKKFVTGIYPYSMMQSVFTPLDGNTKPLKLTTSSQEWCGHTFSQYNHRNGKYNASLYSYFESEGDTSLSFSDDIILEDAIWNTIRINPQALPTGKVLMLPGNLYLRLSHQPFKAQTANCSLSTTDSINTYTISYTDTRRKMSIYFSKGFPYNILGWEEAYPDIMQHKTRTTKATLKKKIMLDYWTKNKPSDTSYRKELMIRY